MDIDRKTLDAEVVQLEALVSAIKSQQGSASERTRNATLTALGQDVVINSVDLQTFDFPVNTGWRADDPNEDGTPAEDADGNPLGVEVATFNLGSLASFVAELSSWAEQVANETVTTILKASTDSSNLDALREQYKAKREYVDALLLILNMQKIDVSDVVIPALRGSGGPRNRSANKSHQRWYRIVKGERKDQAPSQNSLSSFAYWHGAKLMGVVNQDGTTNNGKGVSSAALEQFLRKGITDSLAKSWSVEVDGVTYGMDIADTPSDSSEEE